MFGIETLQPQKNHNRRQKLHYYNNRTIQVNDDDDINDILPYTRTLFLASPRRCLSIRFLSLIIWMYLRILKTKKHWNIYIGTYTYMLRVGQATMQYIFYIFKVLFHFHRTSLKNNKTICYRHIIVVIVNLTIQLSNFVIIIILKHTYCDLYYYYYYYSVVNITLWQWCNT